MGIDAHMKLLFDEVQQKGIAETFYNKKKPFEYSQNEEKSEIEEDKNQKDSDDFDQLLIIDLNEKAAENSELQSNVSDNENKRGSMMNSSHCLKASKSKNKMKVSTNKKVSNNYKKSEIDELKASTLQIQSIIKDTKIKESKEFFDQQKNKTEGENFHKFGSNREKIEREFFTNNNYLDNLPIEEKKQIISSFTKHTKKISEIFQTFQSLETNENEIKSKISGIVSSIIEKDTHLVKALTKGIETEKAAEQITEYLYSCMFEESECGEMSEIEDIDMEIMPKEKFKKKRKITQAEVINEKLLEMNKKIEEIEIKTNQINIKEEEMEIELKGSLKGNHKIEEYEILKKINEESFKALERSKKVWNDSYLTFANKKEIEKALLMLDNKINSIVLKMSPELVPTVKEFKEEDKCLCCTKSLGKSHAIRINLIAGKEKNLMFEEQTQRKSQRLKKKTLELLKNETERNLFMKMANKSFA